MSSIYITEPATSGKVCLKTTVGDIDVELWTRECPLACRNFIQLCMEGYYDGVIFHRLVKDFIVQTGDPTGTGHGGESIYGDVFKSEFHQRLQFSRRGLVGMAGEQKDENGSQFFFTLGAAPELTKKHTLFGKVVGATLFNMLKLNECDVDKNERPTRTHKILGAEVLLNPLDDLAPRRSEEKGKNRRSSASSSRRDDGGGGGGAKRAERKRLSSAQKNTKLLSFGDEVEEGEEDEHLATFTKKFKSKSAHDVLEDELLSREKAVEANELGGEAGESAAKAGEFEEAENGNEERLGRIREKMRTAAKSRRKTVAFRDETSPSSKTDGGKRTMAADGGGEEEEDLENLMDEHRKSQEHAKLKEVSEELKSLQKEYIKSVRAPKQPKSIDDDASTSTAMKSYNKMKLKFKASSKNIVKEVDVKRQVQSLSLLERFNAKMERASVRGILMDKKVDVSDLPSRAEVIEAATAADQGKVELDSIEDLAGEEWMNHKLVAPEGIRRDAKDANLKDVNEEEWYDIADPRNKMNVRKREGLADLS